MQSQTGKLYFDSGLFVEYNWEFLLVSECCLHHEVLAK